MSLCLLMTLAGSAVSQPLSEKPPTRPEEKPPALLTAKPLKADPKDDELRKLLKARYNAALAEAKGIYEFENRPGAEVFVDFDRVFGQWQRLVQAGLEVCDTPAEKVALLTQYVELTKDLEKVEQKRFDVGRVPEYDLHRVRYQRLDAEIQLLRAKRDADKAKGG